MPHAVAVVQIIAALVHIGQLHGLPIGDGARIRRLLPAEHSEQGGFSCAIGADHPDNAASRQLKGQILDQEVIPQSLAQVGHADNLAAQPRPVGDHNLRCAEPFTLGRGGQLMIGGNPRPRFRLPRLLPLAHPFQLPREGFLAGFILARLLREPLRLLFQPAGIIPLIGKAAPAVQFQNPAGDVIEEIAIVGHNQNGALISHQVLLQPSDRFSVKVVGWLVQKQQVRGSQQQLAQSNAPPLPA